MNANISKGLMAYVLCRDKYFADPKNIKPIDEIEAEIFLEQDELPVVELALILKMIREDHHTVCNMALAQLTIATYQNNHKVSSEILEDLFRKTNKLEPAAAR
jgi:hypothetical protein